jgi:hypothetical protein
MVTTTQDVSRTLGAVARPERGTPWSRIGFLCATLVLLGGFLLPLDRYISPRNGAGYILGIVGGSLMLALLIYPLRKRVAAFAFMGSAQTLFSVHMLFGIVGPLCILYHSNYHLGAANSNVALFCMLIVAGSGLIGRYLYARIHYGLHGRLATLSELRTEAAKLQAETSSPARMLPELSRRMTAAERRIASGIPLVPTPLVAALAYFLESWQLKRYVHRTLHHAVAAGLLPAGHRAAFETATRRYLERRLAAVRRVAEFDGCAKLFALWHVLHIPLFFMLLIAGIVHVIAVHVY